MSKNWIGQPNGRKRRLVSSASTPWQASVSICNMVFPPLADTDMKPNKILEAMRRGEKAVGASLNFPSETIVELLGIAGLDFVHLDAQHGAFTLESVERHCRAAELAGLTPMSRVPDLSASTIL